MILPLSGFHGDSPGEEFLWNLFHQELPDSFISFHGYYISLRKSDIIMLVPDKGVLIIENKSIYAKSVSKVPDNTMILRYNKPPIPSPLKQADNYRYVFLNEVLGNAGIDSVMVLPSVSYPYITEKEFFEKHLDKISIREITFLKEDLANAATIQHRIDTIFKMAYEQINAISISKGGFNLVLMEQVANLISPDYRNNQSEIPNPQNKTENARSKARNTGETDGTESTYQTRHSLIEDDYSLIRWDRTGKSFTDENIQFYIDCWLNGIKLFLYTADPQIHSRMVELFSLAIKENHLPETVFKIKNNLSFRLEIGIVTDDQDLTIDEMEIHNGDRIDDFRDILEQLDLHSSFNYGQYLMEHAPCMDVKVTAGAGTGKTHTMVSRISFLIWKHHLEPTDFSRFLIMITFTNKSADEMKHRLFEYFLNYYQLTHKTIFFEYLEAVEDIQISTIHSLCRMLLSKFGTKLGLGTEFRITTGTYRRREILREEMNRWLQENPDGRKLVKMKLYFLEKRLEEFIDKIDNKNVDLVRDRVSIDFGSGDQCMPESLMDVIVRTQKRLDEDLTANNSVSLKSIIRKIGELCDRLSEADFPEERTISYLFVDEFQDTDNVQIELIQRFQALAHFNIFVVGDTKQCIYRFRGADDEAFHRLTEGRDFYSVALKKNYRTDRDLLEEMNKCFISWDRIQNLTYAREDILTGVKSMTVENALQLIPVDLTPDEDTLVQAIQEAVASAEATKGQAAILVRNNYQIENILDLCRRNQIAISSEIGGRLFQSDPTIDLYKLLLALKYHQEPEYLYNLYTTSYIPFPLPKAQLTGKSEPELIRYFDEHCGIPHWKEIKKDITSRPVMQVLQSIVQETRPWDNFAKLMGENGQSKHRNYYMRNLDQVFERLINIANQDYLTINKLLDYLEIMIATRQQAEERETFEELGGEERIICTTVHKAKGMEFDTVILPYCQLNITNTIDKGNVDVIYNHPELAYRIAEKTEDEKAKGAKPLAFYNNYYENLKKTENKSREREETRILYVAMTRAKRRLICMIPQKNKNQTTWGKLIEEGLK